MLGERTWAGRLDRSRILLVLVMKFAPDCVVIVPDRGAVYTVDEVPDEGTAEDAGGGEETATGGGTNKPSLPRNHPAGSEGSSECRPNRCLRDICCIAALRT